MQGGPPAGPPGMAPPVPRPTPELELDTLFRLDGKRALLVGGYGGIGEVTTRLLALHGADVADPEDVAALVDGARERFGQVEILVNNAGVVSHRMLEDLDLEEWRRVIDTNLTALYLVTKGVVEVMPAGGSVIIVGSAVATRGMPARAHYASSKAGAIGFMRALCKELGPRGIRVNLIAPGIIETDQVAGLTEEGAARYAGLAALHRLGSPDEIAGAALFLASDLASFVSGVTLNVDGGI